MRETQLATLGKSTRHDKNKHTSRQEQVRMALTTSLHKYLPAVQTILVFLLAQGLGTVLIVAIGILLSPDNSAGFDAYTFGETQNIPLFEKIPASLFAIALMAVDILAVLCCYFLLHNIRFDTTLNTKLISWRPGLLAIAAGVLGALSISVVTDGIELPEIVEQMSKAMSHNFWGVLAMAIVGPVTEELLFREAIEGEMLRRGAAPWTAISVSALAFSAAHLNLAQGFYALPLGILFGIIYFRTGNIVLTSLLHILNNGIAVVLLHTLSEDMADTSFAEWFGSAFAAYTFMAFSGILCIVLMKVFWDCYPNRKIQAKSTFT